MVGQSHSVSGRERETLSEMGEGGGREVAVERGKLGDAGEGVGGTELLRCCTLLGESSSSSALSGMQ